MPTIPADMTTVENAISAWIAAGSGLAADHVWIAGQGQPRDDGPYITWNVISDVAVGAGWQDWEDAAAPQDGAEIVGKARETVQQVLSIQAFAGAAHGASSAMSLLRGVRLALARQGILDALNTGGVGVGRVQVIGNVGSQRSAGVFEPRAVMNVVVFLASETSETGTFIETVETRGAAFDTQGQSDAVAFEDI